VTRKSVEEHGGTIDMRSEEGKGTVFTLQLPFHPLGAPSEKMCG